MLERLAAESSEATEAFAKEDAPLLLGKNDCARVYFSVIVTTAELVLCEVLSEAISLTSGTVDEASFSTVPYVRFRKQFSIDRNAYSNSETFGSPFVKKENTVLVVNSDHLLKFLDDYDVSDTSFANAIREMR